jgi:hypothetical protein
MVARHRDGDPHLWRDAAVLDAVGDAVKAGDGVVVRALADDYGALLTCIPVERDGGVRLERTSIAERRRRGGFATPAALAAVLARHALPQLGPAGSTPTVVDPACGPGALLLAGFERLLELEVPAGEAFEGLHGVDADPGAVAVCRAVLAVRAVQAGLAGHPGELVEELAGRIVVGDALLGATPTCPGDGLEWHRVFGAVLDRPGAVAEPVTGWRGGFDAVLANPPWERLKVTRKDWAGLPPPELRADRAAGARSLRDAGRHPLTGIGELNAYLPFVETCWRLLAPAGRAAIVVPAGVASDRSSSALLRAVLDAGALDVLHLLDPAEPLFDGVSRRVGVAVMVFGAGPHTAHPGRAAQVAIGVRDPAAVPADRCWPLDAVTLRRVNPNTATAPLFGTARDAAIVAGVHRRLPVLIRRDDDGVATGNPWQLQLVTPLHMTRDARYFTGSPGPGLLPLWEAKHAGLLDHRGGKTAEHRYWVPRSLVEDRYGRLTARGWLAGYRNVTTADSPRTLLPTALPVAGVGNSLPLLHAPRLPLLLAALASLPVDYVVRQKHAGANLNFFKLEQAPLPPPEVYDVPAPWQPGTTIADWVLDRFARAIRWDDGLAALAAELADAGIDVPEFGRDPGRDTGRDTGRDAAPDAGTDLDSGPDPRLLALAELDAVHAVLLGLSRDELAHALSTFTALRLRQERQFGRFVTGELALAGYDAIVGPD